MATTSKSARSSTTRKSTARKTAAPTKKKSAVSTLKRATPTKAKASVTQTAIKDAVPAKVKKTKLVRDSFTIPKTEYAVLHALKARSQKMGHAVKKSELLRAGIKLMEGLSDSAFKAALQQVPVIKTGRPKSAK